MIEKQSVGTKESEVELDLVIRESPPDSQDQGERAREACEQIDSINSLPEKEADGDNDPKTHVSQLPPTVDELAVQPGLAQASPSGQSQSVNNQQSPAGDDEFKVEYWGSLNNKNRGIIYGLIQVLSFTLIGCALYSAAVKYGFSFNDLLHRMLEPRAALPALIFLVAMEFICFYLVFKSKPQPYSIKFSPAGLTFSSNGWEYELVGGLHRAWSDIHSVQLVVIGAKPESVWSDETGKGAVARKFLHEITVSPKLMLDFKSGGSATIVLRLMTRAQAETLFRALEKWGNPSTFDADVVKLEKSILLEQGSTFTELWQEDFNSRYVATNYVALRRHHELQQGKYRVLLQLASGGMSAVYLAITNDGKKVVLKEAVTPSHCDDNYKAKAKELFDREARLLLQLNHDQIAKVLDSFIETARDYLVLAYIPGQNLRQIVQKSGPVVEARAINWAVELCSILEYLHGCTPPVVHRDLSPDNIILREDGKLVVVDFGAANEYLGVATGTFIGKQCYMAAEQVRGHAGPQSDIYSLGATLFFVLTGADPIPLQASKPKEKVPSISDACNRLVAQCTDLEVAARPGSASQTKQLFESIRVSATTKE